MSLIPHEHYSGIFVKASVERAAQVLLEWGKDVRRFTSAEHRQTPFDHMWTFLRDRKIPTDRGVLVPHGRDWTAFFDNDRYEQLSSSIGYNLCRLLHAQVFEFDYDSRSDSVHEGSAILGAWTPSAHNNTPIRRWVMLSKEPSWKFVQTGEPFPFENVSAYAARKKRDRLTLDMLRSYAESVGIRISDPTAYGSKSVILYEGKQEPEDVAQSFGRLRKIFGDKLRLLHPRLEE